MRKIVAYWPWVAFAVAIALVVSLQVDAQEQPAPDLAKENAQLKQQIAQLQQQKAQPTMAQLQDAYAKAFKEAFEKAEPGCKAVRGAVSVSELEGKLTITCSRR